MKRLNFWSVILFLFLVMGAVMPAQANIVLKILVVNPSKEQTQKVPLKVYLPRETKPEDVIDKSDLDIAYDTQQGSYYVYGEFELKPGETLDRIIEMHDIWVIPDSEIETLRQEVKKIESMLKKTEFAERIAFLSNSVDSKLNQIIDTQKNAPSNPERHISDYRDDLRILESAKTDLALARSLMSQIKPTISAKTVWRLIIGIIVFLGLLGAGFYFVWQKQLKIIAQEDTFYVPNKEEPSSSVVTPKQHKAKEEQGNVEAKDIEDILKKESEEE